MIDFKFLAPEHIIFRPRSLFTNTKVSLWADVISVEEGGGSQGNRYDYGRDFGVCNMAGKVCTPKLVNPKNRKFNRP